MKTIFMILKKMRIFLAFSLVLVVMLNTSEIQSRNSLVPLPNSKIELGHSQYVRT